MTDELATLSIAELGDAYRSGRLSPVEVTTAALARLERLNPILNAYVTVTAERALASARAAEAELRSGRDRGPLHGVPISLKDLIATRGIRTTAGSKVLADWVPDTDAPVVRRLDDAGAVLLGKTNMHEFAYGPTGHISAFGPTLNPWDRTRVTGGSSGGSGAGVAACVEYGSLGSDTGGSVRMPAAYCGIVGLKPTFGLVSRTDVVPLSWTLDTIGPMTRTVRDNALLLQAIVGYDPSDPGSVDRPLDSTLVPGSGTSTGSSDVRDLRVGVPHEYFWDDLEPDVATATRQALAAIEDLGATLVEVSLPHVHLANDANGLIIGAEALCYHQRWLRERPGDYQSVVRQRLESAAGILAVDYVRAQRFRELLRREAQTAFASVDVLVTPTMPCVAPPLADALDRAHTRFTSPFNLLGLPAISVPCGFSADRLPIGLQIVGRPFAEATVYRLAYAFEQATEWHRQHPPL